MKTLTVGVVFITHCAKNHLAHCLPPILSSPLKPRVLVMNSSSNDGTVEEAQRLGAEVVVIPRKEFNHGSTREKARRILGTDIVVMMTPDAYATDNTMVQKLIAPIVSGKAAVSYARQIPHESADLFESFARDFNYPATSQLRSLKQAKQYGSYLYFSSDACAAYSNAALDAVGGFPSLLLGEDTYATAKLLQAGHKIAYVAEAIVRHSHRYTLMQEFRRTFDTGLARKEYQDLIRIGGRDEKRGLEYTKALFKTVARTKPLMLPYAGLQTLVRLIAYRIGRASVGAPDAFKRALSSQDFYWESDDYKMKQGKPVRRRK